MRDKKGDKVACSTNWTGSSSFDLVVGDIYEVLDTGRLGSVHFISVKNIKTGKVSSYVPDVLFISIDIYRDFKINEILK